MHLREIKSHVNHFPYFLSFTMHTHSAYLLILLPALKQECTYFPVQTQSSEEEPRVLRVLRNLGVPGHVHQEVILAPPALPQPLGLGLPAVPHGWNGEEEELSLSNSPSLQILDALTNTQHQCYALWSSHKVNQSCYCLIP